NSRMFWLSDEPLAGFDMRRLAKLRAIKKAGGCFSGGNRFTAAPLDYTVHASGLTGGPKDD
ncbi:MAG: hypothetical protein ACREDJ_10020, partial [Methylocella sp.]